MTTLVEFLDPLKRASNADRVLATLFYAEEHEGLRGLRAGEVRDRLVSSRAPRAKTVNVSAALASAVPRVHAPNTQGGAKRWELTDTGRRYITELLGLDGAPNPRAAAVTLRALLGQLTHPVVSSYVEEAIVCLEVGALRAGIVFLWTGAIRHLQEEALKTFGAKAVTSAIQRHDPKARPIKTVEDFAQVKDKFVLLGLREVTLLDKGEWGTLQEALDLRNRCGHPTKYKPGSSKAESFVEDVVGIAFV